MLDARELDAESAELLPGREALGKLKFSFSRTTHITRHTAHVHAHNTSTALNNCSPEAVAQSQASQSISIHQ
ncbi:hypothetical protein ACIHFE_15865 [Streptomyces sp. NPDC052396]|uniref:hypothetical protein n=1 Tax=Streptomyces sp. NPDC052396 TaxID=3365689 RepID=UPI0037D6E27A